MNVMYFTIQQTMYFFIPLLIVALGGLFSERSGITNIALEGTMIIGAFAGVVFINTFQHIISSGLLLLLGLLIAAISGIIISLIHAYASITMNADQTISGTAINILAPAFAIFTARMIYGVQQVPFNNQFIIRVVPILGSIPIIGSMFFRNTYATTYLGIFIFAISSIALYKTKFGLRLRACGDHPQAADSVGINVRKMRYAGVLISGALSGLGGLVFIIPTSTDFSATVSGYGFLALAVLIFGQWHPQRIFFAALFFGLLKTLTSTYSSIPFLAQLNIPSDIYKMAPYIATILALLLVTKNKRNQAPRAVGVPYDKSQR